MNEVGDKEVEIPPQPQQENVDSRTEWIKFGDDIGYMHFVGKDVIAIRNGCHILFHDLITNTERVYTANSYRSGDGIAALAGYRNISMFAFAEHCFHPRIFIMEYPSFTTISILKDDGNSSLYHALVFAEMEYLISLGSLPDFEITVWSWRSGERLTSEKTGIMSTSYILRCSPSTPPVVSQMASDCKKLLLWEIHACYKKCLLTKLEFNIADALLPCAFTWTPDGILLITDKAGSIFMIEVEKRKLQHIFNWTGDVGLEAPCIVWYKGGIVLSGPSREVKHYKRVSSTQWEVGWSFTPDTPITRLSAYSGKEILVALSAKGDFFQFKLDDEGPKFIQIASYGRNFTFVCFINPAGDHIVTMNEYSQIRTWYVVTGNKKGEFEWNEKCLVMMSNPIQPYVALGRDDGIVDFINLYNPGSPKILTQVNLCHVGISGIQISLQGNYIAAGNMESGLFFIIQSNPGVHMGVMSYTDMKLKVADFVLMEQESFLKLIVLVATRICCPSGDKMTIFSMTYEENKLNKEAVINLPGLYSGFCANPFGVYQCYGIPHRSRQVHLLQILIKEQQLHLLDARSTGHQLRKYTITVSNHNILTYGLDGMAMLHSSKSLGCITCVIPHHRMNLGIKKAVADPLNKYIVTLGEDGSLICTSLKTDVDKQKEKLLIEATSSLDLQRSFTKRQTSGFMSMTGLKDAKTWLELQEDIKVMQENMLWGKERTQLYGRFKNIQKECVELLEMNYKSSPEEKLPISAFDLDEETKTEKRKITLNKCKDSELYLTALISAQDKLCEKMKKKYWDIMETKGRKLRAIFGRTEVESYPLYPNDILYEEELKLVKERRKLEVQLLKDMSFHPWESSDKDDELDLSVQPSIASLDQSNIIRETIRSFSSLQEHMEEEERMKTLALSGSSSHRFIELPPYHHKQFELITYFQIHNEIILLMDVTKALRKYFNKQFNDIYALKEREMFLVAERNARLRYILSELNNTWTTITDPIWSQEEEAERIMKVEDNEVSILPYISPSQQEILDRLAAEEEARRLAELSDNFRERALITMMDGVLEIRWEDIIKIDIPKPKCMLEKNPEDYNEEDLKIIKEYEEKVEFLMSERERYRNMLQAEFQKLSQTLKDGVMKFNDRLDDLFLLKLKIESAIGQENMKISQAKYMVQKRFFLHTKDKNLRLNKISKEASNSALFEEIQQLQAWTNDCRSVYESLVARDKHLEKNFKKEFPEVSQVVLEQLYKFYRRRPKMHQKTQMSVTLLNELSRCTMSPDRPSFLPPEYLDFLKGLDQIDNYSNSPPIINEDLWTILCRVRRLKVECELKARCCALEVAESEQTVNVYQKRLTTEKQVLSNMQEEYNKIKQQLLELQHNRTVQIVMKQGLVEVDTTGSISDFDDAILITREQVESINNLVKKAGNQKLMAMHKATNFHRYILVKEWEHKKLQMEIEDLQDNLHNLESIKVTKDIQMYLRRKVQGTNEEKDILSIEREVSLLKESYEKDIKDIQEDLDELDKKIDLQYKENRKLDNRITDLNVDVNEQQLLRDLEYETKQTEAAKQRMAAIVKRSQLVATIQKQHSEILALQTEVELLRLKTYPTLKYKTLI